MKMTRLFERLKPGSDAGEDARVEWLRGIFACSRYPLVYFNLPKCACTTIKNLMYVLEYGEAFPQPLDVHKPIATGNALIGRHEPDRLLTAMASRRLSFTFVRHPLKRAYSAFNEKIFHESEHSFRGLRNGVLRARWGIQFPARLDSYSADDHAENFARFLEFVAANLAGETDVRQDPHWLPQSLLLHRQRKRGEIDFVGRLERYAEDMAFVLRSVGVAAVDDLLNLRFNEGLPPPYPYREVLTDRVLDLGRCIFDDDLQRLAYPLETR